MFSNISKKTFFLLPALFLSSYVIGAGAGSLTSAAAEGNWGLSFHEENTPPTANASTDELAQYDAYYRQDSRKKFCIRDLEPFLSFLCCIFLAEDDRNEPYLFRWFLYIFSLHPLILFEMIQELTFATYQDDAMYGFLRCVRPCTSS